MNTRIVSAAVLASVFLAACSPKITSFESADQASKLSTCSTQQKSVSLDSIAIEGGAQAAKAQAVSMRLTEDPTCAGLSSVEWNAPSAKIISQEETGIVSSYAQPGHYIVQAKLASGASLALASLSTTVVDNAPMISGPQVAMIGMDLTYAIVAPTNLDIASVTWNFGDGGTANGLSVVHQYQNPGDVQIAAVVTLGSGQSYNLSQAVTLLFYYDNFDCIADARISAPQSAESGSPVSFMLNVPSCMTDKVSDVKWSFGDAAAVVSGQSVSHTYGAIGLYDVSVQVYSPLESDGPLFTLHQQISIVTPAPVVPVPKCATLGEQKTEYSNEVSSTVACGIDGKKDVVSQTKTVSECRYQDLVQDWVVISSGSEVKSEGACQGQSCALPDGSKLLNGGSKVLYASASPVGACSTVSQSRTCNNGVLSGDATYVNLSCSAGCGDFGVNGTVKTGVVNGSTNVALQCQYGEQGYFNVVNLIEDRACVNGSVVTSNSRQGSVKTAGACPTYSYQSTGNFTSCSANCGGSQTLIHSCVDSAGHVADKVRCGAEPVVSQVCDGNPAAAARQDVSVATDDSGSSSSCPKNQIGIILKSRQVTTTSNYACINHSVQLASQNVVPGAWVEESYCRDYVAYRCSQDSLSNTDAHNRYLWMVKCQEQVPVIKEFLENFADVTTSIAKGGIESSSRVLYPTFMDAGQKPEKPWIAPKLVTGSCVVPPKVYIAAVCVSSCATPEQNIMVEGKSRKQQSFIEALTAKTANVATLASDKSPSQVVNTPVEQWVTELIDTEHQMIVFRMASGGSLTLTPNHTLLAASGEMHLASEFKVGDELVRLGGKRDRIVSLTSQVYFGKVYNLFTTTSDPARNIVVTGGYLNGSAFFQNEGAGYVNTQVLRTNLVKGVFAK